MPLSTAQVRHVATLARLSLSGDEEQRFAAQLSAILDAFEALQRLDTEGVEPTTHPGLPATPLREDQVEPSLPVEQGLANAPERAGTSFAVPKIIE